MMQTPAEQWQLPLLMGIAMDDDTGDAGLRSVVAKNLRHLMDSSRSLKTLEAVETQTERGGFKVGKSTIGRLLNGQTPISLDKLSAIGKAFGVEAWQMLNPDGATPGPAPQQQPAACGLFCVCAD